MTPWQRLDAELEQWSRLPLTPTLWWRDDDAQQASEPLARLNRLSIDHAVPLALAVIPDGVDPSLDEPFSANPLLSALQHGFAHSNHAPAGERKCELGDHRPMERVTAELKQGREALLALLAERFHPVLVPPWNRLSDELPGLLAGIGLTGLSTLGPRPTGVPAGLVQVNVHVDLIDWRGGRCFAGDEAVIAQLVDHLQARRLGRVDADEATGIMSHHLAHDEGCWRFLEALLTACAGRVQWCAASALFS